MTDSHATSRGISGIPVRWEDYPGQCQANGGDR